jgi:hypothetical protein
MGKKTKRAKGEPARTARIRYIEPATKKDGNPFFAARVPKDLLKKFQAHAKTKKSTPAALVREFMAESTGFDLDGEMGEE